MNARKAKAIRKLIFGDLSVRLPLRPNLRQVAILARLRVIYRRAKRSYRDGSCALLLPGMAR
jgi:hypothetical protein